MDKKDSIFDLFWLAIKVCLFILFLPVICGVLIWLAMVAFPVLFIAIPVMFIVWICLLFS